MAQPEEQPPAEIQKLAEHLSGDVSYFKWLRKLLGGSKVYAEL